MEQNYSIKPNGVCARQIDFTIENGTLHNVKFYGGCPGNTLAISKLLEGYDAQKAIDILKGIFAAEREHPVPISWQEAWEWL